MDKIVTLVKVVDKHEEDKFYYYVDYGNHRKFFYDLVEAENYIKSLGARYEFKTIKDFLVY